MTELEIKRKAMLDAIYDVKECLRVYDKEIKRITSKSVDELLISELLALSLFMVKVQNNKEINDESTRTI